MAFAILQRRQALTSAHFHLNHRDFRRICPLLASLSLSDFRQAADEERRNIPVSNRGVRELLKHTRFAAGKVMGSNTSRQNICSEIWSMVACHNAPSIWLTINLDDIHDPIAQVFAGEHIDLNAFQAMMGPNPFACACNIAKDPCTAADFFHCMIETVFQTLFQVTRCLLS